MNKKSCIQYDTIIVQANGFIAADLDGEKAMMSVEKGKYYGLDTIGSTIWELIAKPMKVNEVIEELMKEYDVGEDTCQKEVSIFLNKLYAEGLVSIV